jgi:hypothetical protein
VTPFDPVALVAMLMAFYPIVSPATLVRARAERPEYFAGGVLLGHSGDKLQLPDGRIWDLIFAVDGPIAQRKWQALDVTNSGGGPEDPFALEPGPLTPVDEAMELWPAIGSDFAGLVAGHLAQFGGSEGLLDRAAADVVELQVDAALESGYAATIEPALEQHAGVRAALDADNPVDVLEQAEGHGGIIDQQSGAYDEEPPPDLDEPDPGSPPADEPPGHEPPPQA